MYRASAPGRSGSRGAPGKNKELQIPPGIHRTTLLKFISTCASSPVHIPKNPKNAVNPYLYEYFYLARRATIRRF
jgi:hypothetical protein